MPEKKLLREKLSFAASSLSLDAQGNARHADGSLAFSTSEDAWTRMRQANAKLPSLHYRSPKSKAHLKDIWQATGPGEIIYELLRAAQECKKDIRSTMLIHDIWNQVEKRLPDISEKDLIRATVLLMQEEVLAPTRRTMIQGVDIGRPAETSVILNVSKCRQALMSDSQWIWRNIEPGRLEVRFEDTRREKCLYRARLTKTQCVHLNQENDGRASFNVALRHPAAPILLPESVIRASTRENNEYDVDLIMIGQARVNTLGNIQNMEWRMELGRPKDSRGVMYPRWEGTVELSRREWALFFRREGIICASHRGRRWLPETIKTEPYTLRSGHRMMRLHLTGYI